jgi:hypothetical protein
MPGRRGRTSGHPSHIYLLLKTVFSIYCVQCVHVADFPGFLSSTVSPLYVRGASAGARKSLAEAAE